MTLNNMETDDLNYISQREAILLGRRTSKKFHHKKD